jgi:hypothetical protein
LGRVAGDHGGDVLDREPGFLGSQVDSDLVQVLVAVAAVSCGRARRREETHAFPVPEDVRPQTEPGRGVADGQSIDLRVAFMSTLRPGSTD